MYYVGLISGTSMDAVDAALVSFKGDKVASVHYRPFPIVESIRAQLRALDERSPVQAVARLDVLTGSIFAQAVMMLLKETGTAPDDVTAIGSHGQTIMHAPGSGDRYTLQIGDPNIIALETGITTVADFRRMDMAAGGQGAPFAPAFHAVQFRSPGHERVVLNLGGIANITLLPADANAEVIGFDTGPGNGLMDDWAQRHLHRPFDQDGHWAASGQVHSGLLNNLLSDDYLGCAPPKSTGRDYFNLEWLDRKLAVSRAKISPQDVQATLARLTARSVADAVSDHAHAAREILVCGGGVHNAHLMVELRAACAGRAVQSTANLGLDPDAVEAVTFAWLARRRLECLPGNLPSVTGAKQSVVCGAIFQAKPGAGISR
jgi:anhydro-N-acetylmuramic acid kinase